MSDSQAGEPRMFIDGELVDAASGATFENVNPASEEVIGHTAERFSAALTRRPDRPWAWAHAAP